MKKSFFIFAMLLFASFLLFGCETTTSSVDQFTITFNSNGGSTVTTITRDKNASVNKPTDPTKSGFTFDGWLVTPI